MRADMDIQTPSPQTTLAILLGASEWPESPDFPGSKAFANAISSFRSYLFDPRRFGLPKENVLDLFDVDDSPHTIDRKIRQFLEHRTSEMKLAGNVAKDLLLYFVGHGGFVGRNSDYYLAVRCTSTEDARLSGIPMESLASTLTDKARYLRRIIILDCCYAAAAFTSFQAEGPAKLGIDQTFNAFETKAKAVGKGTALLCSSGKTVASQIAQDQSFTMFSKALLQVLFSGDERRQEQQYFSLREVADLTEEVITRELEGKAPRPEIHSPDQKEGDVALIPFFPNPAMKVINVSQTIEEHPRKSPLTKTLGTSEPSTSIPPLEERRLCNRCGAMNKLRSAFCANCGESLLGTPTNSLRNASPSRGSLAGTTLFTYLGHTDFVWNVKWSPDGSRIASASKDGTAQVWHAATGQTLLTYRDHMSPVYDMAWSPDGSHVASGSEDKTVQIWDATTGQRLLTYHNHTDPVRSVGWSPDGSRIASGSNGGVQVWDATTGQRLLTYRGQQFFGDMETVAWSPNGKYIASVTRATGGTVEVWDVTTGDSIFFHEIFLGSIAWSPDSKQIVLSASDFNEGEQSVWDITTGNKVLSLHGLTYSVAWSPNGKYIASGDEYGTAQIWEAATGREVLIYHGQASSSAILVLGGASPSINTMPSTILALAWSRDSSRVASASTHEVQVWQAV
jgi:hypothetical protein